MINSKISWLDDGYCTFIKVLASFRFQYTDHMPYVMYLQGKL